MAEPKKKTSRSRRDNRRSHHALNESINLLVCEKCGSKVKPHTICSECGTYPKRTKQKTSKDN